MDDGPARGRAPLIRSDAVQRLLAFGALVVIIIVFSLAVVELPARSTTSSGSCWRPSVNGILALGVTFVIITGGIDLSIGTVMTLCGGHHRRRHHEHGPAAPGRHRGRHADRRPGRARQRLLIARFQDPAVHRHAGHAELAKGLALVISGLTPIYFNDAPEFNEGAMGSLIGSVIPGFDIPNVVLVMFGAALIAELRPVADDPRALHVRARQQRGGGAPVGRQRRQLEDHRLRRVRPLRGSRRRHHRRPAQLGPASRSARATSSTRSRRRSSAARRSAAARASILGTVIGAFIISTLTNGLRILSVPQEWQTVVTGGIVILAVYLDIVRRRRQT